ncbi:redoxin domain-containing protein [Candidatus Kaiserbacteria bacterium]|nr:redoxin domain-containing protein [Candidatus Kaiserbacteria bacterium]USN92221.1 MAG: redoxin domain-containing protein [Candidatus Nomurabacteria bacterium]
MENTCKGGCCEDDEPVFLTPLTVGDIVPEEISFDVYHKDDFSELSFKELREKWVILMFYPKDFTFVCPTELGEMNALYEEFQKEGAEVVSVSTDTVEVHKAWHDGSPTIKDIKFPMAADPTHLLSEIFGVLIPDEGVTHRGTFIISPEGEIMTVEVNCDSIGRSGKETMRKFKAAKYVGEHPANVCPASWNTGDDTLTPGVDLVGKI